MAHEVHCDFGHAPFSVQESDVYRIYHIFCIMHMCIGVVITQ